MDNISPEIYNLIYNTDVKKSIFIVNNFQHLKNLYNIYTNHTYTSKELYPFKEFCLKIYTLSNN